MIGNLLLLSRVPANIFVIGYLCKLLGLTNNITVRYKIQSTIFLKNAGLLRCEAEAELVFWTNVSPPSPG
jgi:hypothetical protein